MLSCLEHMYHDLGLVRDFAINPITLKRWLVSGRTHVPYEHTFTRLHKRDYRGAFQMTRGVHGGAARMLGRPCVPTTPLRSCHGEPEHEQDQGGTDEACSKVAACVHECERMCVHVSMCLDGCMGVNMCVSVHTGV